MKAYKGFNTDMTCRKFQYEEGKTYEEPEAKLCKKGFHACLEPIDILYYYPPSTSVYREVELENVTEEKEDDSKRAAKKITIGKGLNILELVKKQYEYIKSKNRNCYKNNDDEKDFIIAGNNEIANDVEYDKKIVIAENHGIAIKKGLFGIATAYKNGISITSISGISVAVNNGIAISGIDGKSIAGTYGVAYSETRGISAASVAGMAIAGPEGIAASRGAVQVGKNGVGIAKSENPRVSGDLNAVLTIVKEYYASNKIKFKTIFIDGEKYKANTWYKFDDNDNLVEDGPAPNYYY